MKKKYIIYEEITEFFLERESYSKQVVENKKHSLCWITFLKMCFSSHNVDAYGRARYGNVIM